MSNQGVRGFYQITETIKNQLLADVNVNTVTTGDITEIDLSKQTIFPLCHIIVNNVTIQEQVLDFNISVLAMDIVDQSKQETTDIFRGNNNEQDIINTQLAVVNSLDQEEMNSLQLTNLEKNGDGMEHYSMNSLKEILHELKISLN